MNFIKDAKNQWTVVINNKSYVFDSNHKSYNELVDCIRKDNTALFLQTMEVGKNVASWSVGSFLFKDGILSYGDEVIDDSIVRRIVDHMSNNIPVDNILAFLENLYKNPSYRAIKELYRFLEHKSLPVTSDGCFLAYKAVHVHTGPDIVDLEGRTVKDGDYIDKWTKNRYRNNVGDSPTMSRHKVDDNCESHCSEGLHAGTISYASGYANSYDKLVIVKINPMNVVSIPTDCDCQKLRTCSYVVVGEYERDLNDSFSNEYEDEDEDDDEDFRELDDPMNWEDEYTKQDSDDADAAMTITGDFGASDEVVVDARRTTYPPIPTGWELFTPVVGERYPNCKHWYFGESGDPTWHDNALQGHMIDRPDNENTLYIKESK